MELEIKNRAHDKAFATIFSLDNDISRLKQEIKDDASTFYYSRTTRRRIKITQKMQRKVWDYIALLIEKDHEKIDYLDYEKQNELT